MLLQIHAEHYDDSYDLRRRGKAGAVVGRGIDLLVALAKDAGCSDAELEEQLQLSLDRYDEAKAAS